MVPQQDVIVRLRRDLFDTPLWLGVVFPERP